MEVLWDGDRVPPSGTGYAWTGYTDGTPLAVSCRRTVLFYSEFIVNFKYRRVFILVLGIYYLLYMPGIINVFVTYSWKPYSDHVILVLLSCNGIASPLIYVWHSETFRHYMYVTFGIRRPAQPRKKSIQSVCSSL